MKKIQTPLFLFSLFFLLPFIQVIQAQDVAICGWDGSGSTSGPGDEFSFVLLRDFAAGEVIYFTEEDYSDANNSFSTGEGHLAYTVPAGGLLENDVVKILDNGSDNFLVQCAAGTAVKVAGTGNWSFSSADEIYAYSASNPASPWNTITEMHCFIFSQVIAIPTDQNPSSDWPNTIIIAFNIGGSGGVNADLMNAARVNTTLAMLQNGANWTTSAGDLTLACTNFTNQMLPVELINFKANKEEKNILLNWSTATEINNDYFQIEHSIDGKNFEKIARVEGVGNSSLINHYNFTDKNPTDGMNYYRLKQVDFDGRFEYSDIVSAQMHSLHSEISVYPNPFIQSISLEIPLLENYYFDSKFLTLEVYDIYGKLVHSAQTSLDESVVNLDLFHLNKGIYFLHMVDVHETSFVHRIVKH